MEKKFYVIKSENGREVYDGARSRWIRDESIGPSCLYSDIDDAYNVTEYFHVEEGLKTIVLEVKLSI